MRKHDMDAEARERGKEAMKDDALTALKKSYAKSQALKKKKDKYTGKKSEYSKVQQGNFMKVHPLDR